MDSDANTTIQLASPAAATSHASSSGKDRPLSCSSVDSLKKGSAGRSSAGPCDGATQAVVLLAARDDEDDRGAPDAAPPPRRPGKTGAVLLPATALLVLAWWVSSLVLPATRHRWVVQSLWAWFFVLVIVFRFVPAAAVARPVAAAAPVVPPVPARARLALLWLAALAITFASAFGFARPEGTAVGDRAISLAGVYFFQLCICGLSHNRRAINWTRIPISIVLQQALALFVLKSRAGFNIAAWFNAAVADFCTCAVQATAFIFDPATAGKAWFFVSGLGVIIFVAAFVQMLYFFNWMQWFTKQFAWLGQHLLGASGAETFVALWSPWFGQANSALLVGPYIPSMTDAEMWAIMAVSMSSLSSLLINSYTILPFPIPLRNLLAQSAIVIPGAIINAKIAFPEVDPATVKAGVAAAAPPPHGNGNGNGAAMADAAKAEAGVHDAVKTEESASDAAAKTGGASAKRAHDAAVPPPTRPLTRSRTSTCAARKKIKLRKAHDLLDCLSDGAGVGIRVAGFVLANFFTLLALLVFVNGTLVWIFRGFGVHSLDLHQVLAGVLYPFVFFLGVPRREVFSLAYVAAGKMLVSADFAYGALSAGMAAGLPGAEVVGVPFSTRGFEVMTFALGDTASLASLGIQVGVMTALAPASRKTAICRGGIPALLVATLTTFQAAAIAASVL